MSNIIILPLADPTSLHRENKKAEFLSDLVRGAEILLRGAVQDTSNSKYDGDWRRWPGGDHSAQEATTRRGGSLTTTLLSTRSVSSGHTCNTRTQSSNSVPVLLMAPFRALNTSSDPRIAIVVFSVMKVFKAPRLP
jgi:hypothetical protein